MNEIHEVCMYMVWSNEVIICVEMMDKFYVVCWLLCYGEMGENMKSIILVCGRVHTMP